MRFAPGVGLLLCFTTPPLFVQATAQTAAQNAAPITTETAPPQYLGVQTHVPGVFVTPVPNVPFTALVDISSMRVLPDGSTELRKTVNHIARASNGSIYNERRMLVGVAQQGQPRLLSTHVYDPQTRVSLTWTPFRDVAQSVTLTGRQVTERKAFLVPVPGTTEEKLGASTMSGVMVQGLRRTRTLPAPASGAAKPIQIVDEYWYSEDLRLVMLEKHDDPRTGEQIVTVLDVQRDEPPAKLFQPPNGYRVVDVTGAGTNPTEAADPFAPAPANVPVQRVDVH